MPRRLCFLQHFLLSRDTNKNDMGCSEGKIYIQTYERIRTDGRRGSEIRDVLSSVTLCTRVLFWSSFDNKQDVTMMVLYRPLAPLWGKGNSGSFKVNVKFNKLCCTCGLNIEVLWQKCKQNKSFKGQANYNCYRQENPGVGSILTSRT